MITHGRELMRLRKRSMNWKRRLKI